MAEIFNRASISNDPFFLQDKEEVILDSLGSKEHTMPPLDIGLLKKQAFAEGYALGFSEGGQNADKQSAELVQQLRNLLQTIPNAMSEGRQALKNEIADIVLAISEQFFIDQQLNKEKQVLQIKRVLQHLNEKQTITLALNPKDLGLLQAIDLNKFQDLRVIADENLKLGGCLITSEHGIFDASIEQQIERLKRVLLQIKNRECDV